jgi:hypothetical protein
MVKHLINSSERDNMKVCTVCSIKKPLTEYYSNSKWKQGKCKPCHIKQSNSVAKKNHLRRKYNISLEEYNAKLEKQHYCCALCGKTQEEEKSALCVDHNHETGQIRDLLCRVCNRALGLFKDDPQLLIRAAEYLERHND